MGRAGSLAFFSISLSEGSDCAAAHFKLNLRIFTRNLISSCTRHYTAFSTRRTTWSLCFIDRVRHSSYSGASFRCRLHNNRQRQHIIMWSLYKVLVFLCQSNFLINSPSHRLLVLLFQHFFPPRCLLHQQKAQSDIPNQSWPFYLQELLLYPQELQLHVNHFAKALTTPTRPTDLLERVAKENCV